MRKTFSYSNRPAEGDKEIAGSFLSWGKKAYKAMTLKKQRL